MKLREHETIAFFKFVFKDILLTVIGYMSFITFLALSATIVRNTKGATMYTSVLGVSLIYFTILWIATKGSGSKPKEDVNQ